MKLSEVRLTSFSALAHHGHERPDAMISSGDESFERVINRDVRPERTENRRKYEEPVRHLRA